MGCLVSFFVIHDLLPLLMSQISNNISQEFSPYDAGFRGIFTRGVCGLRQLMYKRLFPKAQPGENLSRNLASTGISPR